MKNCLFLILMIFAVSCGKKKEITIARPDYQENIAPYDTIATDSFSVGATPNNVILNRDTVISVKKDSLPKTTQEKLSKDEKAKTEKPKEKETKKQETKDQPKPDVKPVEPKPESPQPTP